MRLQSSGMDPFCRFVVVVCSVVSFGSGIHVSVVPDQNAFVLFGPDRGRIDVNSTTTGILLQDGCPSSTDQSIVAFESGLRHYLPFATSIKNFHCAVSLRVVNSKVNVDRPFVDVLVVGDHIWLSFFKQPLCVTVQIANPLGVAVTASCTLSPYDLLRHHCLIRTEIPFSWFLIDSAVPQFRQVVLLTYAVGASCIAPAFNRPKQIVQLEANTAKLQSIGLDKRDHWRLSLQTRSNLTFSPNSLNAVFVHVRKSNVSTETTDVPSAIHFKAWIDSRFEIISASPVDPSRWTLRIESAATPDYHTLFTCNYTATSEKPTEKWDGYLFVILLKMKPESNSINENLGTETIIHWAVNYVLNDTKKITTEERRVSVRFPTDQDSVYGIVAVPRHGELINTAVLTGTQSATTMRVFTVSLGGIFRDVTVQSHCISAEARVLKTSPTCSSVYVDGSELRGLSNIQIHVHYESWTTNVAFTVWYPKLPIQVWISDPVLNAVDNWPVAVWKWLPNRKRHRREARQFACKNTYQQAEIRILGAFQYGDERTGERVYLTGERDTLLDVTSLAANRIQSSNSDVVTIRKVDSRLLAVAKKPGNARIVVKAQAPLIDYGSGSILVTDETVIVKKISARTVVELEMELYRSQRTNSFHYDIVTRPQYTFTHRYQHGSIVVSILYTDDQIADLESIDPSHYTLSVFTSDERGMVVNHKSVPELELIALDDTNDITVHVQLRSPAHCEDLDQPPLAVARATAHLFFNDKPSKPLSDDRKQSSETEDMWRHHRSLIAGIFFISGAVILYLFFGRGRHRFHNGYEKLVVPILARFGSNSGSGTLSNKEEDSKEWVWLSKAHIDNSSLGSRYSQKSTIGIDRHSSGHGSTSVDDNTQRSISYRGSEISVFIAPQPSISINEECDEYRHTTSWKRSNGVRMTKNPMIDSSSEHNLKRLTTGEDYGPFELQYPPRRPSRKGSWREPTSPITLRGLRESIA